jgi:hypothetical protein
LISVCAWVFVNVLVRYWFGIGVVWVLGFVVAIWAALDCSKISYRGSRVLGIVFKPIVVFTVCAFLGNGSYGLLLGGWLLIESWIVWRNGFRMTGLVIFVFGLLAFSVCASGFIWYLVMRHRVLASEVNFEENPQILGEIR